MDDTVKPDAAALKELAGYRMPFGKHKGERLVDLPEPYVTWFARRGFPRGKLGRLMREVFEIKLNGLEYLFRRPTEHPTKSFSAPMNRGAKALPKSPQRLPMHCRDERGRRDG